METVKDPVDVAPDNYDIPLENERVRVLQVHLKPGEKIPEHSHPASVIFAVSDCKAKFTYPDGKSEIMDLKAGQSIFTEAFTHWAENIGDTECHVLNIELRK